MFIFTWLSRNPSNVVIYYPNRILKGMDPWEGRSVPGRTRNPFAWIQEALSSTESDIVSISGIDTAVYFVFLSTVLGILVLSGLVLLPILLPIAGTGKGVRSTNTTSAGTFNDLDKLSMGHIREKSWRLWAFMAGVYWTSIITYYLLWKSYTHVVNLRATALAKPDIKPEQYAILVRDIPPVPKGITRKQQVDNFFKSIYPDTFYKSMIITDNTTVNKTYNKLQSYRNKLARAESTYQKSKTPNNPNGTRPMTTKPTILHFPLTKKIDTIDYLNQRIRETIIQLKSDQNHTLTSPSKQFSSAIIFFTNRITSASAAQTLLAQSTDTWTVLDAPEPRDLIWTNLNINFYSRQIRQCLVYFSVSLTILFYIIPIGFVSAFTTLSNLMKLLPFIKPVVSIPVIRTVLEAYLPQLALILFLALLPGLLMFLTRIEGIPSISHAVRGTSGKYFYFTVLNVFIGVTIGGTLFSTFKEVESNPNQIITLLATSLPDNATFFLTYVALKFLVGYGLELSRIIPLIIFHFKKKYLCKTEIEIKQAWAPGDLSYSTRVPNDMLIITIVLCYSVIAPMIIPFGVAYFGLGWLVLRNQALKVYVPSFESYGKMWPHMHLRLVAALILYQVTMVGYFGVKKFYYTPILIPLPIASLIFSYVCRKKFYRFFQYTAVEIVASDEVKESPNMEQIYNSFLPDCLILPDGEDPFEEEDASSAVSKSTVSV